MLERFARLLNKVPELLTPKEYRNGEFRNPYEDAYERTVRESDAKIRAAELAYEKAKEEYEIAVRKEEMGEAIRRAYRSKAIRHRLRS